MHRPNHPLTALEARKQLLVLEAEIQRQQVCSDIDTLAEQVRGMTHKVASFGSLASAATLAAGGIAALRGSRRKDEDPPSKLSRVITLARWGVSAWLMFRNKDR